MSTAHPDPIVIVSAARTPIGGLLGDFSALSAHQLGAVAIRAAVQRAGITGDAVSDLHWRWTPDAEERLIAQSGPLPPLRGLGSGWAHEPGAHAPGSMLAPRWG